MPQTFGESADPEAAAVFEGGGQKGVGGVGGKGGGGRVP